MRWLIADVRSSVELIPLHFAGTITSLGRNLKGDCGELSEEAIEETLNAIKRALKEAKEHQAKEIYLIGTAALRRAKNVENFLSLLPLPLEILTPEQEGEMAFWAVRAAFPQLPEFIVVDQGGGSIQVVYGSDEPEIIHSLPFGVLDLTEMFFGLNTPGKENYERCREFLRSHWNFQSPLAPLVGLGGTITSLSAVALHLFEYDPEKVHGYPLKRAFLQQWLKEKGDLPLVCWITPNLINQQRAYVLPAGVLCWLFLMDRLGNDVVIVSEWGIRHGYLLHKFQHS
ncbi:MAG: Ppx/GppA phosphatase family protein [bacterium JZ-2024 1]